MGCLAEREQDWSSRGCRSWDLEEYVLLDGMCSLDAAEVDGLGSLVPTTGSLTASACDWW
jgi:hypothetical protein